MSILILASILLRAWATARSLSLLARVRDRRVVFLCVTLALMTLRLVLTLARGFKGWSFDWTSHLDELPGLVVSVLAVFAVVFLDRFIAERRASADAFQKERDLATAFLDTAGALMVVLDRDGRIVRFNRACELTTGYPPEEVLGRRVWDFLLAPEDIEPTRGVFQDLCAGRFPNEFENAWVTRDGRRRRIAWANTVVTGGDGTVEYVIGTGVDVTGRHVAERKLRDSEELFSTAFHSSPMAIIISAVDDGAIIDTNDAFLTMSGYTRDEAIGRRVTDLGMWADPADRAAMVARLRKAGVIRGIEGRFLTKTGQPRTGCVSADLVRIGGRPCMLAIAEDVTDRREAERARQALERNYQNLFDTSRDGIVLAALDGRLTDANRAFLEMLGYTRDEITRLTCQELTPPQWHDWEIHQVEPQLRQRGFCEEYEKEYTRKDGTVVPISVKAWLQCDAEDRPIGRWSIVRDITERKRAEREHARLEEQLRRSQKMEATGALAAGVAHDFNNLLMAIQGYTELARASLNGRGETIRAIEGIERAARQATQITKSLLTFSRKAATRKSRVCLARLVVESAEMLRLMLGSNVRITVDTNAGADAWIEADATQMQQVLMNLALNARDAMPRGGELRIAVVRQTGRGSESGAPLPAFWNGTALLTVEDTGRGIPKNIRERIFEPFFTTKEGDGGSGLGMSVVHGIVTEHRGVIDVDSVEGRGTRVTIAVPCCEAPATTPTKRTRPRRSKGHGELIILGEDNDAVRAIMTTALRGAGYGVVGAADGIAVMDAFEQNAGQAKLVLLDLDLPGRSGADCVEAIRRRRADLTVMMIAGGGDIGTLDGATMDIPVLRKPFQLSELVAAVDAAMPGGRADGVTGH